MVAPEVAVLRALRWSGDGLTRHELRDETNLDDDALTAALVRLDSDGLLLPLVTTTALGRYDRNTVLWRLQG